MTSDDLYKAIRIKEIKEEVSGFKSFVFEEGHNINYKAGQYLTLLQTSPDGAKVRRSYSITSSPLLNEPLSIGVKRIENGFFSRQLIDVAKAGDELRTTGSGGLFILPDDIENFKQIFFFAAGSGITPIYSLVKTALYAHHYLSLVLIYSNASADKTVFLKPLQELQKLFPSRFHLKLLFSDTANLFKARLHRELILEFLNQLSVSNRNAILFYVCGPETYMRLCTYTLQENGIHPDNIKTENFIIHNVAKRDALPPDKENYVAHIRIGNLQHKIFVRYPDSILKAAKKQSISLPYSCEAGRCGNCVAKCTSGTVWLSYNEVLTEKELQKGLVLTCVGHPVGGDVMLEIH
jgi:ring-1,2-phenylacetyl-CoA epoxidase subunit PaaE